LDKWNKMYKLLEKYKQREGDCDVPFRHIEDGEQLGKWLKRQQTQNEAGTLDRSYAQRLELTGLVWGSVRLKRWNEMYELLKEYKLREGNCKVPAEHKESQKNLGGWLVRQRMQNKGGTLDSRYIQRLSEIGVVWGVRVKNEWNKMYKLLKKYKLREGDCDVTVRHIEDGVHLGQWLKVQRLKKTAGTINSNKAQRLELAGVVWGSSRLHRWNEMYELLKEYKLKEGNYNVPVKHKENQKNLGQWLAIQRCHNKAGTLESRYAHRLTEIGVV